MLPSSRRVSRIVFDETMRNSKVFHAPHVSIRIGTLSQSDSRFSFVVSKKVDKRATKRNAIRRKGYAALSLLYSQVKTGFICLVFAKKGIEAASVADLQQEIADVFTKAGLFTT